MEFLRQLTSLYTDLNPATLSGAIDVVVVRQPDGSLKCSPFHVRFGKLTLLQAKERTIRIKVNGKDVDIGMRVGKAGEAYFVEDVQHGEVLPTDFTSALTSVDDSGDETGLTLDLSHEGKDSMHTYDAKIEDWTWGDMPVKKEHEHQTMAGQLLDDADMIDDDTTDRRDGQNTQHGNGKSDVLVQIDDHDDNRPDQSPNGNHRRSNHDTADKHRQQPDDLESVFGDDEDEDADQSLDSQSWFSSFFSPNRRQRTQSERTLASMRPVLPQHSSVISSLHRRSSSADALLYHPSEFQSPKSSFSLQSRADRRLRRRLSSDEQVEVADSNGAQEEDDDLLHLLRADVDANLTPSNSHGQLYIDSAESGNGTPTPVRDEEDENHRAHSLPVVELSLCGPPGGKAPEQQAVAFNQHRLDFAQFAAQPDLLTDSRLMVRIGGEKYFTWAVAGPYIISHVVFHQPLPESALAALSAKHKKASSRSSWLFGWGSRVTSDHESANEMETDADTSNEADQPDDLELGACLVDDDVRSHDGGVNGAGASTPKLKRHKLVKKRVATDEDSRGSEQNQANESMDVDGDVFRKTLRLSSEQLESLQLQPGANTAEFSVVSKLQGRSTIDCRIFLFDHDTRIIISDIDGTVTRSDVLGHAAALVGTDWTQAGIASFYSHLQRNGYQFLYLSSRSISQSAGTREYLQGIAQGSCTMPNGPVLLSPSSLFKSFHREVIQRRPEEFKISCLSDIQNLFCDADKANPFIAGFGNRQSDVITYRAVGISDSRIFVINPQGQIRVSRGSYLRSSYALLEEDADMFFPPIDRTSLTWSRDTHVDYDNFTYWKEPILELTDGDEMSSSLTADELKLLGAV